MCVFCSFLLLSNSSCFVFLFQTKKNEKKNIVALTQYSRARIFPHTHFSTSKNFKCRAKIFTFRRIKNSFSPCWRFAPSLPFITRSVVPAAGKKSPCLSQAFRLASNRNTLPESKGKRTVPFSVLPKILFLFPTRWWSPVVAGGDTRSTLSSFKAAPDPVIVCVWDGGAKSSLSFFWQRNSNSRIVRVSNTKIVLFWGFACFSMRPLSTEPLQIRFRAAARGNNDVSVGGGGLLLLQHCALLLLFGDYFFIFLTELWSAF